VKTMKVLDWTNEKCCWPTFEIERDGPKERWWHMLRGVAECED